MRTMTIEVTNEKGINGEIAKQMAETALRFKSAVKIQKRNSLNAVNGKSRLSILSLSARKGDVIQITVKGEDEHDAIYDLAILLDNLSN